MKARTMVGSQAINVRVGVSALNFITICLFFSGALYAAPDIQAGVETGAPQTNNENIVAEPVADPAQNKKCLRCHSRERTKTLEDGEELSLQVHAEDYAGSAHGEIACVSCHEAIGNRRHPSKSTNLTIASRREYSLQLNESCRNCHEAKFTQYKGSVHYSMISRGSEKAPVCTDCHSTHAIQSMKNFQMETGYPCRQCHENIYNAYAESVHGSARSEGNVIRDDHIQAPICSDCHRSHDIAAVEIGDTLKTQCFGCHENVPLLHSQWLPNAGTHLDIVSCAVCHAPFAKHRFDLHLFDNVTKLPVGLEEDQEKFEQKLKELEERDGDIDPLAVWKLIEESNENMPENVTLRGRLDVKSGVWAHQIAPKGFAVRTCDSCHTDGRNRALDVTVSVPGQDGRVQRIETSKDRLGSADELNSIIDFFAVRDEKNKVLDILVLLSLIAGFAVPIGHFTLGRMISEYLARGER